MKTRQRVGNESSGEKELLVGIEAKTGPYPAARSWSGGRRRVLGREVWETNTYHVMSRTCGGEVFFDDVEKEALRRLLWKMSEFCGVRLVTYCIMGNHFHALVEVPKREIWLERFAGPEGEEKLFEHLRLLYSREFIGLLRQELAELRKQGMESLATAKLERLQRRFCDLSLFVKEVKERFSRWFNKRRERRGTLWMDRFKSVLVEGKGEPLHTMAAYIDLNPVRAGLVEDPKDYRWSGYGEAMGGSQRARRGLVKVTGRPVDGWESAGGAEAYRCLLFSSGVEIKDAQNENVVERGVTAEEARAVLREKGRLSTTELVRLRVRYFSDGLVLGSRENQTDSSGAETSVRYYHSDQAGSTLALTDSAGEVTGRAEYTPYGVISHTSGVMDTPYLFNGAYGVQTDFQTGLIHMRARYYHPWLGRFISEDPIQFEGGNNWYAFANGDPVMFNDPSGHILNFIIGGAIGGAMVGSGGALIAGAVQAGTMTTGAALAAGSGLGAVGGASGNVVQQLSLGASLATLDYRQVGVAGTLGAAFGGLGSAATVLTHGVQTSSAAIMQQMQRNLISYETQFIAEGASQVVRQSVSQSVMSGMASVGASRAVAMSAIWTTDQLAMPFLNQATESVFINQLPVYSRGGSGRK